MLSVTIFNYLQKESNKDAYLKVETNQQSKNSINEVLG